MRMIGTLPAESDARRFCDYLLAGPRVAAHAEAGADGSWQLWVEDDDRLDAAAAELRQFRAAPADPRYAAADAAGRLRREQTKAAERRRRNFTDVRTSLFASPNGAMPVAMVVIGLCVVAYLIPLLTGQGDAFERLALFDDYKAARPGFDGTRLAMFDSLLGGQVWRLVTPAFLHGGPLHLLFNMMWMLDLGRRIEPIKGSGRFTGLVLGIAAFSNLAQAGWAAVSPWQPDHYSLFLGMSGVVAGLFGYAWMCGRFRPYERVGVTQGETGYMIGWLVICSFGFVGPIANAAHWGGLVMGMALGAAPRLWKRR